MLAEQQTCITGASNALRNVLNPKPKMIPKFVTTSDTRNNLFQFTHIAKQLIKSKVHQTLKNKNYQKFLINFVPNKLRTLIKSFKETKNRNWSTDPQ
uniref:Putative ovule protein n=1 Tax=Solanum chacoense TaxID=4108 RepID=A0A0V0HRU9_SOLCH